MDLDKYLEVAGLIWIFSLFGYAVKKYFDFLLKK
jgi:hypothetical protein